MVFSFYYLYYYIIFSYDSHRHSDMIHTTKNCGYDGGINKTHDIDLYEKSEFHRIHRVSKVYILYRYI